MEFKREYFNIPNTLSASRIVLLPILYLMTLLDMKWTMMIAYIIIASTDFLDGKFARRFNQSSELGKTLDSVADILFYLSTAFFLYWFFPGIILEVIYLLWVVIGLLAVTFIYSWIRIGKPTLMHTSILRTNAVLVMAFFVLCYFIPRSWAVIACAMVLSMYIIAFAEEMVIWTVFGEVDRDARSFFQLLSERKKEAKV